MQEHFGHYSVLLNETIESLDIKENGIYVDCTLGGAGHANEILKRLKGGKLIGIDRDEYALEMARERLKEYKDKAVFLKGNFCNAREMLHGAGIEKIDGVVADLGVSSFQLDNAERGFSYMKDAPLDMRMSSDADFSAYDVVNGYDRKKLANIIDVYGEEKFASRIAENICKARETKPIETTFELSEIIKKSIPSKFSKDGHPSKRTFQAIRIEVNGELDAIGAMINGLFPMLVSKGRMAVITFHSLEDRIVKHTFAEFTKGCECPSDFPVCVCGKKPTGVIINKKPIIPGENELKENSRSKSAKLRVIEKI
ncbi:MAG: 16S rRNA (cytosine(1402)-N(4))-methyltransferase RsmH [Clostridiales bacterium]|nr:16S rRNA (cytosine(1402)-N(4))-methyltransferase RsmH [Clostridiales bacterium]